MDVLKLDPKDLYATVFEGSAEEGLERDNEAASYWEQFLPKDHILNGNKHDNFWEMGDTGPCLSLIHISRRIQYVETTTLGLFQHQGATHLLGERKRQNQYPVQ